MRKHNLLFLIGFIALILSGCASKPVRLLETETEPAAATAPVIHANDRASSIALQALAHLGTPYRVGGLSPQTGFDCSGLVAYVYREGAGLALPRNTFDLAVLGQAVERAALRPGDLVFYNTQRREYSHVGIYLGEDRFIHAPASGGEVRVESLRADYWMRRYNGARRVIVPPG
ncbi:MAG: peptidoglycan endopeptidase [Betaproteobacteria bacterium]|nr:MAG: peptidoglycan endopeptidase [Betaproteobacteria bacterium]